MAKKQKATVCAPVSLGCPQCHRSLRRRKLSASADVFFCSCGWGGFVSERLRFKTGSQDCASNDPMTLSLADILSVASGYMVNDMYFIHAVRERLAARCGSGEAVMMSYAYRLGFEEALRKAVNDYRAAALIGELSAETVAQLVETLRQKYPELPEKITI